MIAQRLFKLLVISLCITLAIILYLPCLLIGFVRISLGFWYSIGKDMVLYWKSVSDPVENLTKQPTDIWERHIKRMENNNK